MRAKNPNMSRRRSIKVLTDKNQNEYTNFEKCSTESDSLAENGVMLTDGDHLKELEFETLLECKSRNHDSEVIML